MRAVEKYYSVGELALLLSFSEQWVRNNIHAGSFPNAVDINGDLRVPASDVNNFIDSRRVCLRERPEPGIAARTVEELRRKIGRLE